MNNENVLRKNSQKNADAKIEYSHPYIGELVQNMPKYHISSKTLQANLCWGVVFLLCKYLSNADKNCMNMITI